MKNKLASRLIFLFLSYTMLSGCIPFKPRTLWFKADPYVADNTPRRFRIEISHLLTDGGKPSESEKYAHVLELAEYWSRHQEHLCKNGITPLDYGYDQKKMRYWMVAECKSEIQPIGQAEPKSSPALVDTLS